MKKAKYILMAAFMSFVGISSLTGCDRTDAERAVDATT